MQEILDRVVDLLDSSVAELAIAKETIKNQAITIRDLTQLLHAAGRTNTVDNPVDQTKPQSTTGSEKEDVKHQPQQLPPTTTAAAPAVLAAIESSSSSKPSEETNTASISGFEKLTVDLNELEDFITSGTNVIIDSKTAAGGGAGGTTQQEQPIIAPVSARDRIAAFEKASKEAILLQQRDLLTNKSPELASQCKITAAARAGNGDGGGSDGAKGKKEGK